MIAKTTLKATLVSAIALTMMPAAWWCPGFAQEQTAPAPTAAPAPEPLSADELEVLVARIALYPDELVAVISAASLYPLQIVDAARYLEAYAKDKNLKPKESWDGSVVSLLNYPEVVKMMSDDLEWTQSLRRRSRLPTEGRAHRHPAVARGSGGEEHHQERRQDEGRDVGDDNIIIQSASSEEVYVPRYEPAMLYEPNYVAQPVGYYPESLSKLLVPDRDFLRGGGNRCDLGRGGRLGRLGRVGR